eukprot:g16371.t1
MDVSGVVSFWRVLELAGAGSPHILGGFLNASYLCIHPQQQAQFVALSQLGIHQAQRQGLDAEPFSQCSQPTSAAFNPFFSNLLLVAYAEGDLALFDCSLCVPVTHWACAVIQAPRARISVAWSTRRPAVASSRTSSGEVEEHEDIVEQEMRGAAPAADGRGEKREWSDAEWAEWNKRWYWWDSNTDVAVWRRAEKILKTLDWGLQAKLDHVSEATLASPAYLSEILRVLDVLAGENDESERRRAVRAALFEGTRKSDESLAQYALRRESQFENASRYMSIPEDIKGILLEEQSGLSKQGMQSLRVLTRGRRSYSEVKKALRVLDLDEESMIKPGKVSYFEDTSKSDDTDSEADRETLENHWFHFTRKLLILNRGPGTLETLGIRQQPGDYTTSRPGPSEGMMSSSEAVLKGCRHPKEYETRGANQHGTWTCCNLCQQKTGYQKYGKDNPPPAVRKSRTAAVETYVPKTPAAAPRTPMVQASSSTMSLMPDLESAFRGQNEQLLQNTASIMSQVMTPVVEGFHQALRFQAEEAQRNQERQEIQLQQLFMQQQRIMQQTDPATQPGAAFPALAPEELHRLLAQGFAMAQQAETRCDGRAPELVKSAVEEASVGGDSHSAADEALLANRSVQEVFSAEHWPAPEHLELQPKQPMPKQPRSERLTPKRPVTAGQPVAPKQQLREEAPVRPEQPVEPELPPSACTSSPKLDCTQEALADSSKKAHIFPAPQVEAIPVTGEVSTIRDHTATPTTKDWAWIFSWNQSGKGSGLMEIRALPFLAHPF